MELRKRLNVLLSMSDAIYTGISSGPYNVRSEIPARSVWFLVLLFSGKEFVWPSQNDPDIREELDD